ncbi:MAG: T9SS type A sorting domain-containing protein, partial [Bacteroidales bacterium]|nr:T9SS type A sorting domain-containing protein [Bacteroidales bacterium]
SGGQAWESVISPSGDYIFSSVSHYVRNSEGEGDNRPAFVILDLEGNFEKIKDLASGYQNGKLWSSQLINDSTAIGSAGWGNDAWEDPALAVKFDTAGNIIEQREVTGGIYLSRVEKTFDNKYLFYTQDDQGPVDHTVYLVKYNQNLEYDTLYNQPMEYDTLCPYPIASDTISLDGCMLSTSSEENPPEPKTYSPEIKVYPNPARGPVTVELPGYIEKHSAQKGFQITQKDYQYHSDAVLHIIDIHGQKIASFEAKGQKKMTVPTQNLSPGVYMVIMEVNGKRYAKEKLIVR